MIPGSYKPAELRCTLPVDPESGDFAFGLNVGDGVQRFRLSSSEAETLAIGISRALRQHNLARRRGLDRAAIFLAPTRLGQWIATLGCRIQRLNTIAALEAAGIEGHGL